MTKADTSPRPNSINWLLKLVTFGAMLMALIFPVWGKVGNKLDMVIKGENRCFIANGIPDHPIGKFPNRANPNAIKEQQINVCMSLKPIKRTIPISIQGTMGIAINGVQFRPNTAGFWDPKARQGHSRQGNANWSLEIFGAPGKLGLDFNNGHVGRDGLYHYHGIARNLVKTSGSSLIGYAGDGFEIHYLPTEKKSGWVLKRGARPLGGPPGVYSGLYNEDYKYIGGNNRLDQCNGGYLNEKYAYFLTDSFPFVPRCLYGEISPDFNISRHR